MKLASWTLWNFGGCPKCLKWSSQSRPMIAFVRNSRPQTPDQPSLFLSLLTETLTDSKVVVVHVACSLPNLWPGGQRRPIWGDGGFTAFPWSSLYDHCIGWQCSSTRKRTLTLPRTRTPPLTASSQRVYIEDLIICLVA